MGPSERKSTGGKGNRSLRKISPLSSSLRSGELVAGTEENGSQSPPHTHTHTPSPEKEMTVRKLLNSVTDTLCIDLLSVEPPSSLRA